MTDYQYAAWSYMPPQQTVNLLLGRKAEHLYSALHGIQTILKRSGMDHTVLPAINTMPVFTS